MCLSSFLFLFLKYCSLQFTTATISLIQEGISALFTVIDLLIVSLTGLVFTCTDIDLCIAVLHLITLSEPFSYFYLCIFKLTAHVANIRFLVGLGRNVLLNSSKNSFFTPESFPYFLDYIFPRVV